MLKQLLWDSGDRVLTNEKLNQKPNCTSKKKHLISCQHVNVPLQWQGKEKEDKFQYKMHKKKTCKGK